ncbi:MAG: hypothetical protein KF865_03555 [Bdellovibrionaceae bacterium]|nr:hypothetical protein [Pseudobdellovibrionaceae bacterium]
MNPLFREEGFPGPLFSDSIRIMRRLGLPIFIVMVLFLLWKGVHSRKVEVDVSRAQAVQQETPMPIFKEIPKEQGEIFPTIESERPRHAPVTALERSQWDLICQFKELSTGIPRRGFVQIFAASRTPFYGSEGEHVVWVRSPDCPQDMYSIVYFRDDGSVTMEVDCRRTNWTELARFSGEQGNIERSPAVDGDLNVAVSGNGYFVLQCANDGMVLTRDGRFRRSKTDHLVNENDCMLVDSNGLPWITRENIDDRGCTQSGICLGVLDPAFDEVRDLQYLNSYSFFSSQAISPTMSVTKKGPSVLKPKIFTDAFEKLHDPGRGPTGISWNNHPTLDLDEIDCPFQGRF